MARHFDTPLGYLVFSLKYPGEVAPSKPSKTGAFLRLRSVNAKVNAKIKPKRDVGNEWSLWPTSGDCEDYAVTKRHELIKAGIPAGSLRIAIGTTASGEGHAVLLADTYVGTLVLDNRTDKLKTMSGSRMKFIAWATADPMKWETVATV